jgi:hypothetical protein
LKTLENKELHVYSLPLNTKNAYQLFVYFIFDYAVIFVFVCFASTYIFVLFSSTLLKCYNWYLFCFSRTDWLYSQKYDRQNASIKRSIERSVSRPTSGIEYESAA